MSDTAGHKERWATVQGTALVIGAVFVIVGVAGFIPGITAHYHAMSWAGHTPGPRLLGVFEVSILLNVVHLAFGVAGWLMARTIDRAQAFLVGGGVICLVLWIYGLLINPGSAANFVPFNTADNWLHFAFGAAMILFGVLLGRSSVTAGHGGGT